jgi:DnaJ family protein C protein 13
VRARAQADASAAVGGVGGASWEAVARHACVKASWRGRYARVLCVSAAGVATLDPAPTAGLAPTNTWRWAGEFGGAALGGAAGPEARRSARPSA